MIERSGVVAPHASNDWAGALMEPGFDALGRLSDDGADVSTARERYEHLRIHIDPVIYSADRVQLVVAANVVERSGKQADALVVITESIVIVSSVHRHVVGARTTTDIFPRRALAVMPSVVGERHILDLYADGRRSRLVMPRANAALEATLVSFGAPEVR